AEEPVPAPLLRVGDHPPHTARDLRAREPALFVSKLRGVGEHAIRVDAAGLPEKPPDREAPSRVRLSGSGRAVEYELPLALERGGDARVDRVDGRSRGTRPLGLQCAA